MSAATIAVAAGVLAVLTALVTAAMHASGGWRGVAGWTGLYTAVVLAMAVVAAAVILAVHIAAG